MKLAWECDLSLLWFWPWDGYSRKGICWKFSMTVQGCRDSLSRQAKINWTRNCMGEFGKKEDQWEGGVSQTALIIAQLLLLPLEKTVASKARQWAQRQKKTNKQAKRLEHLSRKGSKERGRERDATPVLFSVNVMRDPYVMLYFPFTTFSKNIKCNKWHYLILYLI